MISQKTKFLTLGLCIAVLVFILSPYRSAFGAYAPYLLILLCPLLHIIMMRGHGHEDHDHHEEKKK